MIAVRSIEEKRRSRGLYSPPAAAALAALVLHWPLFTLHLAAQSAATIETAAGTGTSGYSGDGGPATAARLNLAYSVAADGLGNLYIADTFNFRIRKVDTAGVITTVAGGGSSLGDGGAAAAAQLNAPHGAALDGAGNLYIADTGNHRIRKVDTAGVITTVAGTTQGFSGDGGAATAAQLNQPIGAALDGAGNLYIADTDNHRIRKVDTAGVPAA